MSGPGGATMDTTSIHPLPTMRIAQRANASTRTRVSQHPGNDYYVNPVTHSIQRQSNRLLAYAAGYILGPYDWGQRTAAVIGAKVGAQQAPSGTNALGTAEGAASAANLGGLAAIGDFFNRLTQGNTWLRVGEVAAGLLILYIGPRRRRRKRQ